MFLSVEMPKYYEDCHFCQCSVLECGEAGKERASKHSEMQKCRTPEPRNVGFGIELKQDCRFLHCWMSSSISTSERMVQLGLLNGDDGAVWISRI